MEKLAVLMFGALAMSCDPPPVSSPPGRSSYELLGPVPGAIFTTTPDGAVVNGNVRYKSKIEVYLDGGPGPRAPQGAAGLDDGSYYFQVTDPSGKALLSEDPALCREIRVANGVIVELASKGRSYNDGKKIRPCAVDDDSDGVAGPTGRHDTSTDTDHGTGRAIVVQLMPFADTPSGGGVYKAWIIAKDAYEAKGGDPDAMPVPLSGKGKSAGFEPDPGFAAPLGLAKTDNFKVKEGKPCDVQLVVRKFHDRNANGLQDEGEEDVTGWKIFIAPPDGLPSLMRYTSVNEEAQPPGAWLVMEDFPQGIVQTALTLDGASMAPSLSAEISVAGICGETHEAVFGNIGLGSVTACKIYDSDADEARSGGDMPVSGWRMRLSGTDVSGRAVLKTALTGPGGCASFGGLLPGEYDVMEVIPAGGAWFPVGDVVKHASISSSLDGSVIVGSSETVEFFNYCAASSAFGTKGFWHNKNGLAILQDAFVKREVNSLDPYKSPSSYFGAGDEPFDGLFSDGKPVAASSGILDEELAPEGSLKSEVSQFLVDPNTSGDPREQLAQQLLAFIFNAEYMLGGGGVSILMKDGTWVAAGSLVASAIAAWRGGDAEAQNQMKDLLDAFNNNSSVVYIPSAPCPVAY